MKKAALQGGSVKLLERQMIHQQTSKGKRAVKRICDRTPPEVRQAAILAYIENNGACTAKAIATAQGWKVATVRDHADQLCDQDKLHRTRKQQSHGGREVIFNLGAGQPISNDGFESGHRLVLKKWPPHHARDPLDCLLFGVPAVLLEQRA